MKTEVLFGIHPVLEAIRANRREVSNLCCAKDKTFSRVEKMASLEPSGELIAQKLKKLRNIPFSQLKSIADAESHQGIGARVSPYPLADVSVIVSSGDAAPFLLLLDSVTDTHNMGVLIRTALCAGVHGVIIPKDRSAMPTPAVSKASAGALEHILLAQVTNLAKTIKDLKKKGVWIAGMDRGGDKSVFDADLTGPLAIVIGGEEKGMRPLIRKQCDFLVSIPHEGPLNSLNASVAGAVAIYEAFRQRRVP